MNSLLPQLPPIEDEEIASALVMVCEQNDEHRFSQDDAQVAGFICPECGGKILPL